MAGADANFFEQPNVRQILRQPISSLRRNRRTGLMTTEEGCCAHDLKQSDLLDYIDSIPLGTLETQLLKTNSLNENTQLVRNNGFINDKESSPPLKYKQMSLELKKPSLESPSPPKLYRMSMF